MRRWSKRSEEPPALSPLQCGRMKIGVAQPVGGDAVQCWRWNYAAKCGWRAKADIVGSVVYREVENAASDREPVADANPTGICGRWPWSVAAKAKRCASWQ
jgi:hypothetical protein